MSVAFYSYTNLLSPYMLHRWRMIDREFPGSLVVLTRHPDPDRPWVYRPGDMDFACVNVPETVVFSNHLSWSPGLTKIARRDPARRIVHLLGDMSGLNALRIIRPNCNHAFFLTNDGGFPETTFRPSQSLRWFLLGRRCQGTMTPGESGRRYMMAWGFPSHSIYNSYFSQDVEAFASYRDGRQAATDRETIRNEMGVQAGDLLVLCVSRLLHWKRLEDLAAAVQLVPDATRKRLVLLVMGNGPHRAPLLTLQTIQGLRFKHLPGVPYAEMVKYYAASDFHVLPSEGDIWGLAVNESLSMGKPVVCTRKIGAAELVKNAWNGFLVPPRSPQDLSQAIRRLAEDEPLRQAMSKNALAIEKQWNSQLWMAELKRMLRDLRWDTEPPANGLRTTA